MSENAEAQTLPDRPIKVAAINFAPVYGDKTSTVKRLEQALRDAKEAGVDLAIFPEAALNSWFSCTACKTLDGPCATHLDEGEYIDGPLMTRLVKLVADLNFHAMIGFFERDRAKPVLYNASAFIGPKGVIGVTRKVHLGTAGVSEGNMCRSGAGWNVWNTDLGPIGVAICFDAWLNPEVTRILALKGAWLIAIPTASVNTSQPEDLRAMAFARARENLAYVATANLVGSHGDPNNTMYFGASVIAGPRAPRMADILAAAGSEPGMAIATLDPAEFKRWRDELIPWIRWRRNELANASHVIAREFAAFAAQCAPEGAPRK